MKKFIIIAVIAVMVIGVVAFAAAHTTSEITYSGETGTMMFENPQTGSVEWIEH